MSVEHASSTAAKDNNMAMTCHASLQHTRQACADIWSTKTTKTRKPSTLMRRHLRGRRIVDAVAVDQDLRPDSFDESEAELDSDSSDDDDDGDEEVDEEAEARAVMAAVLSAAITAGAASVAAAAVTVTKNKHDDDARSSDEDPVAAACILRVRDAFSSWKAWQAKMTSSAPAVAAAAAAKSRSTATQETAICHDRGGALALASVRALPGREERLVRQKQHRRWNWLQKKHGHRRHCRSSPKEDEQAEAVPTEPAVVHTFSSAAAIGLTLTVEPMYPVSVPSAPVDNRQALAQRLGSGVLANSWIGGRDAFDRYPRM